MKHRHDGDSIYGYRTPTMNTKVDYLVSYVKKEPWHDFAQKIQRCSFENEQTFDGVTYETSGIGLYQSGYPKVDHVQTKINPDVVESLAVNLEVIYKDVEIAMNLLRLCSRSKAGLNKNTPRCNLCVEEDVTA
jgi:hypothetical protein